MQSFGPAIATALFIPAMLGLATQVGLSPSLPHTLLALALLLMAPEQAHMAGVDLRQIAQVQRQTNDPRLHRFRRLVWATILGQLIGFSLAATGHLGVGMVLILCALIGFNLMASLHLEPQLDEPIIPSRAERRLDVLALNGIVMALVLLWLAGLAQVWIGSAILAIVIAYVGYKLLTYSRTWRASPPHILDAAKQHPYSPQQDQQRQPSQ